MPHPDETEVSARGDGAATGGDVATPDESLESQNTSVEGSSDEPSTVAEDTSIDTTVEDELPEEDYSFLEAAAAVVEVHGYGRWAAGYSFNENETALATPNGRWDNLTFAPVVVAKPTTKLLINSQLHIALHDGEASVELDVANAEWMFHELFRLRVGQSKQPVGAYAAIYDVGTLRPFHELAPSMYGTSGLMAESYRGVEVSGGRFFDSGFGLRYQAYYGELNTHFTPALPEFEEAEADDDAGEDHAEEDEHAEEEGGHGDEIRLRYLGGGRVQADLPVDGLSLGVSGYGSQLRGTDDVYALANGFAELNLQRLFVHAEFSRLFSTADVTAVYAEVGYMFFDALQLAVRYDHSRQEASGVDANLRHFLAHDMASAAVNYWFSPDFVIKLEYDYIVGSRFARPGEIHSVEDAQAVEQETHQIVAGAAFSF